MGCFLACFGFTKKRKRRKNSSSKRRRQIISEDQSYGRYVPLDSDVVTVKLDTVDIQNQNQNASATKRSDKPKESSTSKIKKKVRFNLNVKSYEPLTTNDDYDGYLSDGEVKKKKTVWELNREERSGTTTTTTRLEFEEEYHHPNASLKKIGGFCSSYPANYRYQNYRNSYSEEEDEIELDDSHFDSDDDDDDDNYDSDGENDSNNKVNSGSMELEKAVISSTAGLGELGKCKFEQLRDSSSTDQSISVLNPVENLTQWKAIKAKSKQQQKENNIVVLLQQEQNLPLSKHISKSSSGSDRKAVDASHSKWLF